MYVRALRLVWPLLLVGVVLLVAPAALDAAEKVDKRKVQKLAKRFFQARPWTKFERWDPEVRKALLAEAEAMGALPEGSLATVVDVFAKAAKKASPKLNKSEIDTPYGEATWVQSGRGGKKAGLVLSLHGGGEGVGSPAAGAWPMSGTLEMAPQGIRLVHDTWNTVHGEAFLLTLIELAKARFEIDPDRVYVAGFSMGGTGSWHMAGRHPDLLAGAIPAHGVIMAEPKSQVEKREEIVRLQYGLLPNVRNLPVYFYTGYDDKNCRPWTFVIAAEQLEELKKDDPGGYEDIRFAAHEGVAHAQPPGEPSNALKFIGAKKRNTFPAKLVWEYIAYPHPLKSPDDKIERLQKEWFYWLHCARPEDTMTVTAERKGNEFDLEVTLAFPDDFTIYLNPEMIDVEQDVVVRLAGEEVYRGKPEPTLATILESYDARLDRRMVFDRKVKVPEPE